MSFQDRNSTWNTLFSSLYLKEGHSSYLFALKEVTWLTFSRPFVLFSFLSQTKDHSRTAHHSCEGKTQRPFRVSEPSLLHCESKEPTLEGGCKHLINVLKAPSWEVGEQIRVNICIKGKLTPSISNRLTAGTRPALVFYSLLLGTAMLSIPYLLLVYIGLFTLASCIRGGQGIPRVPWEMLLNLTAQATCWKSVWVGRGGS